MTGIAAFAPTLPFVTAGGGTLPPADDRLYGPAAYGAGWLLVGVAVVLVAVAGLAWMLWPRRAVPTATVAQPPAGLRRSYLGHLDDLEQQLARDEITPRALHHELSRTLRRFADDAGTAGATAMSASALDTAGLGAVATAVRTYEHPQFEALPESDPRAALRIARAVVCTAPPDRRVRSGDEP